MAAEQIVLFPAGAIRTAQAAHKKDRDTHCNQDCQQACVDREPVNEVLHIQDTQGEIRPVSPKTNNRHVCGSQPS